MGIWNRVRSLFGASSKRNGDREPLDVIGTLIDDYHRLRRLARQIEAHAESAPYPYITERLKQIALEKDKEAGALNERIIKLGGQPKEVELDLHSGKNHWARMVKDIEDEKELENRFLEDALRLGSEAPEISDLLHQLIAGKAFHREALQDLVVKADPQAFQS